MSVLRLCRCYQDTGGWHLCDLHREHHAHIWEVRSSSAGYASVCVFCGMEATNEPKKEAPVSGDIDAVLALFEGRLADRAKYWPHPDYEQETTEGAFSWGELRALVAEVTRLRGERVALVAAVECANDMRDAALAAREGLTARITDYLTGGGLFNPEAMDHDRVRDLLIDCRAALSSETQ